MKLSVITTLFVLALSLAACSDDFSAVTSVRSTPTAAWSPPQQMSGEGDYQSDDFYVGEDKWSLCFSIDAVESGRNQGRVNVIVKEAAPPHYFAGSSEVVGGTGASKCTLMRNTPARYYLIVLTHDRWHLSVSRADSSR